VPPAAALREIDLHAGDLATNDVVDDGQLFAPRRPKDPLDLPVLLVNRLFQPVQITTARRAILLLFGGAALAIDEAGELHEFSGWRRLPVRDDDDVLPIVGGALRVPRVLHLRRYERMRRPAIRLTRRNLMLRDGHQCQYCARRPPVRDLNIDHVVPRSRGGPNSWENLVTACRPCNLRKGRRTPDEAGMRLIRAPVVPRWSTSVQLLLGTPSLFKEWDPFLKAG
jgi:5-methylcytosine-specific restriction endonuclease McrA